MTKPNRAKPQAAKRGSGGSHSSCSRKRSALKERIRVIEQRLLSQSAHMSTTESKVNELIARLIDRGDLV